MTRSLRIRLCKFFPCVALTLAASSLIAPAAAAAQAPQQENAQVPFRSRQTLVDPDPIQHRHGVHYKANVLSPEGVPHALGVHPAVTPSCNSPKLTYFGGPVLGDVQPVVVFWNSDVNPALTPPTTGIAQFLTDVVVSSYMSVPMEYTTYGQSTDNGTTNQLIGNGSYGSVPQYTLTPSVCPATGSASNCQVTDDQIQSELNAQIAAGHLPEPTLDAGGNDTTLYMTYFPPKVSVDLDDSLSCQVFCAYHSTGTYSGTGSPLIYGVLMDTFTSACNSGCGANATAMENMTDVSSHEFAEAITDTDIGLDFQDAYAYPAAWGDNNNSCGEIADICDTYSAGDTITVGGRNWAVQQLWSNRQNKCTSSETNAPPFTVGSPASASTGTPISLLVSAILPAGAGNNFYRGTIHFTSSDPNATLPADYAYTISDAGVHTFQATFQTTGTQTVTVADVTNPSIKSSSGGTSVAQTYTVSTSPTGLSFLVDGTTYTSTQNFSWSVNSQQTLSVSSPQSPSAGTQERFNSWSDSGPQTHNITVSPGTTSYIASFFPYYQLNIAPNNSAYGSISPASGSYDGSQYVVPIVATSASGYYFTSWSGSSDIASASSASTQITMKGPESIVASFAAMTPAATISSPTPGSTFSGLSVTFNWTTSSAANGYALWIGTTGVGSHDLLQGGIHTATSLTYGSMPVNGEKIYVRLYTSFNGTLVSNDYTYTSASGQATMTSPAVGSTFTSPSGTFTWTAASGATGYALWLGTYGAGSYDLLQGGVHTATTLTFTKLPVYGQKIYARLFTDYNGTLVWNDYTYNAYAAATMISPTQENQLNGPTQTFTWSSATGASGYALWLGTTGVGSHDLLQGGIHSATSLTFNSLPLNGSQVYARLYTDLNGTLSSIDYAFVAGTGYLMNSPTPSSTLAGSSVTFQWESGNATGTALWVGTTGPGSHDVLYGGIHTTTSTTVNNIPTNGQTIHVRLYADYAGTLVSTDYVYTAQ